MPTVMVALVALVVGVLFGVWISRRRSAVADDRAPFDPPATPSSAEPDYTQVLDQLSVGVIIVDPDGSTIYRNPAARTLAGTHTGLLVDDTVRTLVGAALAGEARREILELYGPPRSAIAVATEPLPGGGAVASIEDESERRRVDAVRTDFVANISHELKTPVGALAVLAETLVGETDPRVTDRMATRIVDEAHRVARTIDDLLELSRIELGETPIRDPVPVSAIVDGAIERSREYAQQQHIEIAALGVPDDVTVFGDRRQLVSALGNLVENAVKYSEPGTSVQVRVRLGAEHNRSPELDESPKRSGGGEELVCESSTDHGQDTEHDRALELGESPKRSGGGGLGRRSEQLACEQSTRLVEFMVADQGIGIPARDHGRIFERFYRVDKARSRDTGGTGLGLAIVRHVATNHGGEVQVSSQEGEGSTFVLRIPGTVPDVMSTRHVGGSDIGESTNRNENVARSDT